MQRSTYSITYGLPSRRDDGTRRPLCLDMESIVTTTPIPTPEDKGQDRPSRPDPGPRGHIGWIVAGSLATGLVAALLLVAAPFVRSANAAGTLTIGLWDHWVPGANEV